VEFLSNHNIILKSDYYDGFEVYKFMSSDNRDLEKVVENVSFLQSLKILKEIIFDEDIARTAKDDWNYYGVYIRDWYPEVRNILTRAGFLIDDGGRKLLFDYENAIPSFICDFLPYRTGIPALESVRGEINNCYNNGEYLAVMILCRKMAEVMIAEILEKVFPERDSSGVYLSANHIIWFDVPHGRRHFFSRLVAEMRGRSSSFGAEKSLVDLICGSINIFLDEANNCAHYSYFGANQLSVERSGAKEVINRIHELYRKILL